MSREVGMQVERALSADLWTQARAELDAQREGEDFGGFTPIEEEARQSPPRGDLASHVRAERQHMLDAAAQYHAEEEG
jgi:hypothetical protein